MLSGNIRLLLTPASPRFMQCMVEHFKLEIFHISWMLQWALSTLRARSCLFSPLFFSAFFVWMLRLDIALRGLFRKNNGWCSAVRTTGRDYLRLWCLLAHQDPSSVVMRENVEVCLRKHCLYQALRMVTPFGQELLGRNSGCYIFHPLRYAEKTLSSSQRPKSVAVSRITVPIPWQRCRLGQSNVLCESGFVYGCELEYSEFQAFRFLNKGCFALQ